MLYIFLFSIVYNHYLFLKNAYCSFNLFQWTIIFFSSLFWLALAAFLSLSLHCTVHSIARAHGRERERKAALTLLHSTHKHCSLPISAAALLPKAKNDFGLSCGLWPLKGRSLWPKTISYSCWIQWYTICLDPSCCSHKHRGQRGFYSDSDIWLILAMK